MNEKSANLSGEARKEELADETKSFEDTNNSDVDMALVESSKRDMDAETHNVNVDSLSCKLCDARFYQKTDLNNHIKCVHGSEKPYHCHICATSFAGNSYLKRHMNKVHEKKRSHECKICAASYKHRNDLKVHIVSFHEGKKPFKCINCDVSYTQKHNLTKHSGITEL